MPISVVVGGQYGSEGKGKVAHILARQRSAAFAVRVGGPNSGHTVVDRTGAPIIFKHLPTACLLRDVVSVIPAGTYLDVSTLLEEIETSGVGPGGLVVDPYAWVIEKADVKREEQGGLKETIGSTASGTGASLVRKIERAGTGSFAKDVHALQPFIRESTPLLAKALARRERIIIEGTQGFGLSLHHAGHYPYCTSRDTTAAAFISEAGLSPLDVDEVVIVVRTFPIRVEGPSGPLPKEINWKTVSFESGYPTPVTEYTSVTRRVRRVARFDPDIVRRAILYNRPTSIALNHLDYIDYKCVEYGKVTRKALAFVKAVEADLGSKISLLGFGPADSLWYDSNCKLAV